MTVILSCDRIDCDVRELAESVNPARRPNGVHVDAVVGLPDGWQVDLNGLDYVVHCPDHAHRP